MIEVLIEDSHNDKCPKVEANYDDFSERTLRPFNATIFYYFFSGDRRGRTIAQWLLAAARYPNDRVRRAYMRFFAWLLSSFIVGFIYRSLLHYLKHNLYIIYSIILLFKKNGKQ